MGGFANNAPIVTDGLVFYVDAGNSKSYPGSGTTWSDLVGGNDGTFEPAAGPTYDSGNGGSIVFDGTDDYVNFSNSNLDFNAKDFSVLCWFSTTDTTMRLIQTRNAGGSGQKSGWQISVSFNPNWSNTSFEDTNGNHMNFSSVTDLSSLDGQFHLVSLTWDTSLGQGKLYIDNALKGTLTNTNMIGSNINSTDDLQIGRANSGTQYLNGKISNSLIYYKTLSSDEITQNYNALKNRFV